VVTGATDGIGKAYCEHLAKEGINILLISRTLEKLQNVAKELEDKFKVKTDVFAADFTKTDIYEKITEHVKNMDIGILVNNVGMSSEYPDYFLSDQMPAKFCQDLINCNNVSLVMMTRIIAPGMVNRRRGAIMNISSLSASGPMPLMTLYAASKAFVTHFSKTITHELHGTGVIVQTVIPGYVATNMSKIRRASYGAPTPATFVGHALDMFGVESTTFPHLPHAVIDWFMRLVPSFVVVKLSMSSLKQIREKALQRLKKN